MNLLDRLERKIGRFAVRGLMTYIVVLNAIVFLLIRIEPRFYSMLVLDPYLVMKGQVWRLVTYIFIPPSLSLLWIAFTLYFYYMIGNALEHEWGSFRFNVYYLIGMIGTTIGAFITGGAATAFYLNTSLFLAFAQLYPNYQLLLFFVLPVKVKYLAWLDWLLIAYAVVFQPLPLKVTAAVSVLNFFIFFGRDIFTSLRTGRKAYYNRKRFRVEMPRNFTIHRCTVCGITEKEDPGMDFRYCMTCEGDYEYCMNHLENHEHIKAGPSGESH